MEVLRGGPVPARYILEGRALELTEYMKHGGGGQQTFDQHLLTFYQQGCVSREEVLHAASNRESMSVALRGIGAKGPAAAVEPAARPPGPGDAAAAAAATRLAAAATHAASALDD